MFIFIQNLYKLNTKFKFNSNPNNADCRARSIVKSCAEWRDNGELEI